MPVGCNMTGRRQLRTTYADKQAMLARGEPFVVDPREVAKITAAYQTDPEILLGCIVVSGTLDTAIVLRAEQQLHHGIKIDAAAQAAYDAFRRIWLMPTADERAAVLKFAERYAPGRAFHWGRAV